MSKRPLDECRQCINIPSLTFCRQDQTSTCRMKLTLQHPSDIASVAPWISAWSPNPNWQAGRIWQVHWALEYLEHTSKAAMHPDPFVDHIRDVPKRCIRISVLRARRAERSSAMLPAMKGDWEIRQILRRDTTITSTFEPSGTAVKRTPLTCWEASEG